MIEKFLLISKEILKGFIFLVLKIFNTEQSNILDRQCTQILGKLLCDNSLL